jgi:hypothetical protein
VLVKPAPLIQSARVCEDMSEGNAVQRSTVDFGDRPLPTSMRKPSA